MLIGVVDDSDFGIENVSMNNPQTRVGARGIVCFNGKIAVFNKVNKNEFKIPGGGVENDEELESAFKREVLEETGCEVDIVCKLGEFEERKTIENFKQTSHVFVANVTKQTEQLNLTEKEKIEGANLLWVDLDEAIKLVSGCLEELKPSKFDSVYRTKFMVLRDLKILLYYKDYLNKKSEA